MSADTFDTHSSPCPICGRSAARPDMINGLLTCQHCRERLVVSWSGHYVRDPFTRRSARRCATGQMLRRESHPIARIRRDFRFFTHPIVLGALGSAVVLGALTLLQFVPKPPPDGPTRTIAPVEAVMETPTPPTLEK